MKKITRTRITKHGSVYLKNVDIPDVPCPECHRKGCHLEKVYDEVVFVWGGLWGRSTGLQLFEFECLCCGCEFTSRLEEE